MKKITLLTCFILFNLFYLNAQVGIQWANCYGGYSFDRSHCIQQTNDGGYIVAGRTESNDGDVTGFIGEYDSWVVKLDNLGIIEWEKCLGGDDGDISYSIQQTTDGGYITVGSTRSSFKGDSGNNRTRNAFIAKLNDLGTIEWQKSIEQGSIANSVELTTDGGFVVAGGTGTGDGIWVGKFDDLGDSIWNFYFAGIDASSIKQTNDGGYIVAGGAYIGTGTSGYLVIKLDETGIEEWHHNYGGSEYDYGTSIQQTTGGGYIVAGYTFSNDGDVAGSHGSGDFWMVKIDNIGNIEWQKCLGGSSDDRAYSIQQTIDGGYIVAGWTVSNNSDVTGNHGEEDFWVIKTDNIGNIEWQKCLGGSLDDRAYSIQQTTDGDFIVAGESRSSNGDVTGNHGSADFWVAKLCTQTALLIEITNPDYCYTTELVAIGDFDSYLWSNGETTQSITISNGGLYTVTGINENGCPTEAMINAPYPLEPYSQSEICMITLDEESDKNILIYEPVQGVGIDSIMFYRLNNQTSQYDWIGSKSINDTGLFIDQFANPAEQSQRYKIGIRDTCGKLSELSPVHRTILLQANMGINDEVNLFWNAYEGFEYSNFGIYRSLNQGEYVLLANVPNNSYTYIDLYPPTGEKKYQIRIEKDPPCNPVKESYSSVASNQIVFEPDAINEKVYDGIEIYPNPFNNNLVIERKHKLTKIKVEIIDVYGRLIESFDIEKGEAQKIISTEHLKQGVYYLRFDKIRSQSIIKQ